MTARSAARPREEEAETLANAIQRLAMLGQSIWLDNIQRSMISTGKLGEMIGQGLLGMTSNPTIFEKAISTSRDYDAALQRLIEAGASAEQICDALTLEDVGMAADAFRPVFDRTGGADGYVSIEVSPRLAHDGTRTLEDARRLWRTLRRPNVLIKIPATAEGLPAIGAALAEGININVTLMFSMAHYEAVVEAYLGALEQRARTGQPLDSIASVASFFVSRVDALVDPKLEAIARAGGPSAGLASALLGQVAIANSRQVYQRYREIFDAGRFKRLAAAGARRQRVLWASTSTKNPKYPDTLYVDNLVGPDTVNTVPPETYEATLDHGRTERTVDSDPAASLRVIEGLRTLGLEMDVLGEQLSTEGVEKFTRSFEGLLGVIEAKRAQLRA
jgi:transaldolase